SRTTCGKDEGIPEGEGRPRLVEELLMSEKATMTEQADVRTGIPELDHILQGGFTPNRLYLIEGTPGSGKTTLALQYLLEGVKKGEPGLYVTLSETRSELLAVAESQGLSLDGINLFELISTEEALAPDSQYTMFHPSE